MQNVIIQVNFSFIIVFMLKRINDSFIQSSSIMQPSCHSDVYEWCMCVGAWDMGGGWVQVHGRFHIALSFAVRKGWGFNYLQNNFFCQLAAYKPQRKDGLAEGQPNHFFLLDTLNCELATFRPSYFFLLLIKSGNPKKVNFNQRASAEQPCMGQKTQQMLEEHSWSRSTGWETLGFHQFPKLPNLHIFL